MTITGGELQLSMSIHMMQISIECDDVESNHLRYELRDGLISRQVFQLA